MFLSNSLTLEIEKQYYIDEIKIIKKSANSFKKHPFLDKGLSFSLVYYELYSILLQMLFFLMLVCVD